MREHVQLQELVEDHELDQEEDMIRAIVKRPDEAVGHVTNISNRLEKMQGHVEGYIETVTVKFPDIEEDGVVIICNEDGRLQGLPHNCRVRLPGGAEVDFVGTILIVGCNDEEFTDLPEWVTRKEWSTWLV